MDKRKYGMVIGRFQPVHFGHMQIVNEILLDGLIPIIAIGSCNSKDLEKNPLNFEARVELWRKIYPNEDIIFLELNDYESNDDWMDSLIVQVKEYETVLYHHDKPEDIISGFKFGGMLFLNCSYTAMFEQTQITMKQVEFVGRTDIHIAASATSIREDIEAFKHLLDARVYRYLKLKGW